MSNAAAQRRARQSVINLALSLLATLGVVVAIVLMVPRDDSLRIQKVDYVSVANDAAESSKLDIIAPNLPTGWWCNLAKFAANPADTVPAFTMGFVGPKNDYIGMIQGYNANPTWLAMKLMGTEQTGTHGDWAIYTSKEVHDPAQDWDYVRVLQKNENDYVILYGTAAPEDFDKLEAAIG